MARDLVCGMQVDPATAKWTSEYEGGTYYFCGKGCKAKFDAEPQRFLTGGESATADPRPPSPPAAGTQWTCPMHPEIVRDGPGACPICGMALEPMTITAEEPENEELRDMTRRFWAGVVLTVPTLIIGMADLIPGKPLEHLFTSTTATWMQLVLSTPVVLWGGWPFFVRGWQSIVNRSLNMFLSLIHISEPTRLLSISYAVFC